MTMTLLGGCGGSQTAATDAAASASATDAATSAGTSPSTGTTTGAGAATAEGAGTQTADPSGTDGAKAAFDAIVKAAQEEGELLVMGGGGANEVDIVQDGFKKEFGVDIKVSYIPGSQAKIIAQLQMEQEAGATPSYDFIPASADNLMKAKAAGVIEDVDWKQLLDGAGLNPNYYTGLPADYISAEATIRGIVYNNTLVDANELPKTLGDFTDPKWKGQFGWLSFANQSVECLYFQDMINDDGQQFIKDILANEPSLENNDSMAVKVSLGELKFGYLSSQDYLRILETDPNTPLRFQILDDYVMISEGSWNVVKGCEHPNAAKLLALWYCTPSGIDYTRLSAGSRDLWNPETPETSYLADAEAVGAKVIWVSRQGEYLEWLGTDEAADFLAKISAIYKGE
jgi:ABC-type Fe3+ transport system substrate-binding protein